MSPTILVVDDSNTMRLIVASTLQEAGWRVIAATDGRQALDMISSGPVDLIVTDWHMAPLSGRDLARALRDRTATAQLPLIVLSTEMPQEGGDLAADLGLSAWLTKPLDPARLLQAVREALDISNTSRKGTGER